MLTYATDKPVSPSCVQCSECGAWIDTLMYSMSNDNDGKPYCAECAEEKLCSECGEYLNRGDQYHSPDGALLCESCYDDDYTTCHDCGETISREDCRSSDAGDDYCEDCYRDNFYSCERCDCEVASDDCMTSEDGEVYCESCYNRLFTRCDACGNECSCDDSQYDEDSGDTLCPDCYDGRERRRDTWAPGGFRNHSGRHDKVGSARCFGVEVETSRCDDHHELRNSDAWGCKHDCSVTGEEFWSDILSGNGGLDAVDELCEFAASHRWAVNNACGLHVHLDMRSEDRDSLKAIAGAFRLTYEVWCAFVDSRRVDNHYCDHPEWEIEDVTGLRDNDRISYMRGAGNRYQWLNLAAYSEHETFEVRLHHGSIDAKTIKNWIRGLTVFADWAARTGLTDCIRELGRGTGRADLTRKFAKLCKIWTDAGCTDLVDWFKGIASNKDEFDTEVPVGNETPAFTVSPYVAARIRDLQLVGAGRGGW